MPWTCGTRTASPWPPSTPSSPPKATVPAGGLQAFGAEAPGVVRPYGSRPVDEEIRILKVHYTPRLPTGF